MTTKLFTSSHPRSISSLILRPTLCAVTLTLLASCGASNNEAGDKIASTAKTHDGGSADVLAQNYLRAPKLKILQWIQGPAINVATGQVTVVKFWATTCPPCVQSMPHLNQLYLKHKNDGLKVVAISDEPQIKVGAHVQKHGADMAFPVAIGKRETYADYMDAWGISTIPHAFVIGFDGNFLWQGNPFDPNFDRAVEAALAMRPASAKRP